tara:strand:+ start:154 stop:750 length:597 start_codon:yes stop_codon:yes gene_type:complete
MPPRVLCVDGNIGAGKTTAIRTLAEECGIEVFEEDIEAWGPMLSLFYSDRKRWSFALQITILESMRAQWERMQKSTASVVLVERSPISALVFVTSAYEAGDMCEEEIKTYKQLHARMGWVPDTTMWIDTPIDDCMKRIEERGRESESGISRDYIEKLRNLYEDLMRTTPNIKVDGSRSASDVVLEIKKHIEREGYLGD